MTPPGKNISSIHDYNIDIDNRHIWLIGDKDMSHEGAEPGVEWLMASTFIKNLQILQNISKDPILCHFKTNGGHWEEGMAIYDAIKACPAPIVGLNHTHARSMSSIIFQACDKRVMMPHSVFMFHRGSFDFSGTVTQAYTETKLLKIQEEIMLKIYLKAMEYGCYADRTEAQNRRWLNAKMDRHEDVYLSASDAVKYGFADEVMGNDWDGLFK